MKIEHKKNISWHIKNFEKCFMAHQYMPKIYHGPPKNPLPPPPPPLSYILNVRSLLFTLIIKKNPPLRDLLLLTGSLMVLLKYMCFQDSEC